MPLKAAHICICIFLTSCPTGPDMTCGAAVDKAWRGATTSVCVPQTHTTQGGCSCVDRAQHKQKIYKCSTWNSLFLVNETWSPLQLRLCLWEDTGLFPVTGYSDGTTVLSDLIRSCLFLFCDWCLVHGALCVVSYRAWHYFHLCDSVQAAAAVLDILMWNKQPAAHCLALITQPI